MDYGANPLQFWMNLCEAKEAQIKELERENKKLVELVEQYAAEELSGRSHDVDTQF
jgi:hypothetical protein